MPTSSSLNGNKILNPKAPLTRDGQQVVASAGRVTICLTRINADTYRVATTDLRGLAIDCWTTTFTTDRIPMDVTVEFAARRYARSVYREFTEAAETPAQVVIRRNRQLVSA